MQRKRDIISFKKFSLKISNNFQGDSGGPLVKLNSDGSATHVGVVSFVHINGCASGNPSGYVRTASLRSWITENSGV